LGREVERDRLSQREGRPLAKDHRFCFHAANIVLCFLLAAIFIPFFWLYPERHRHLFDVEGTKEQRRALAGVRAELRQKTVWRRRAVEQ